MNSSLFVLYSSLKNTLHLKELICFSDDLMFVYKLTASRGLNQIIATILTSATLTTNGRYHIEIGVELDGITRQMRYLADEIHLHLILHRIGKDHRLAPIEFFAIYPIHYHSVALLQERRKPTCGHREDSECIGADDPCKKQSQHQ